MVASCRTLNYKMRSSSSFIIFLLFIIPRTAFSQGDLPFFENFDNSTIPDSVLGTGAGQGVASETPPSGWTFPDNWRT